VEDHSLQHLSHLGRSQRGNHSRPRGRLKINCLRIILRRNRARYNARRNAHAVIGNGRYQRSQLQRRNANLLPHGDCANGNFRPALHRLRQSGRFAGKLDPGALSKSKGANVFVETIVPQSQSDLDGADVARFGEDVGNRQHAVRLAVADAHAIDDD